MRIIAGEKRSRVLKTLEGRDTRPTSDRVKEALFSILMPRIPGAKVLDLYGGSGALSLEALSRGAEEAVVADGSPQACRIIEENIRALGYEKKARLIRLRDEAALQTLQKKGERFDLIFLDPPYKMNPGPICDWIAEKKMLLEQGLIVVEHDKKTPPQGIERLSLIDQREYGGTGISMYAYAGEE